MKVIGPFSLAARRTPGCLAIESCNELMKPDLASELDCPPAARRTLCRQSVDKELLRQLPNDLLMALRKNPKRPVCEYFSLFTPARVLTAGFCRIQLEPFFFVLFGKASLRGKNSCDLGIKSSGQVEISLKDFSKDPESHFLAWFFWPVSRLNGKLRRVPETPP
jgi:hypothetical protein